MELGIGMEKIGKPRKAGSAEKSWAGALLAAWTVFMAGTGKAAAQPHPWADLGLPGNGVIQTLEPLGDKLAAGGSDGAIHLSEDGGRTWRRVAARGSAGINDFATVAGVHLAAAGHMVDLGLWDCFSGDCPHPAEDGRLLRSTDDGRSWQETGLKAVTAVSPLGTRSHAYAATLVGLHRSEDLGLTWTPVEFAANPSGRNFRKGSLVRTLSPLGNSLFILAGETLWEAREQADGALRADPATPRSVLAIRGSPEGILAATPEGVFRIAAGGASEKVSDIRLASFVEDAIPYIGIAEDGTVFRSLDAWRTWETAGTLPPWRPSGAPYAARDPAHRFCAYGDAILAGLAGQGVAILARGQDKAALSVERGLHQDPVTWLGSAGGLWVAASPVSGLLARPPLPSQGWKHVRAPQGSALAASASSRGIYVADSEIGMLEVSTGVWRKLGDCGRPCAGIVAGDGWATAVRDDNTLILCEDGAGCRDIPGAPLPRPFHLSPVSFSLSNAYHAGWASGDSLYLALDSLYVSADRGRTLRVLGRAPSKALRLVGGAGRLLLASAEVLRRHGPKVPAGLFASDDGGRTWIRDGGAGARTSLAWDIAIDARGTAYMATDSGLYARRNGESAWIGFGHGLPTPGVRSLAVAGNMLIAGLAEGPVMTTPLETVGIRDARIGSAGRRTGARRFPAGTAYSDADGILRRLDGRAGSYVP